MPEREFPWYEIVESHESVLQGDFLLSCPVFVPAPGATLQEDETLPFEIAEYDVIVMSQSCDLLQKKIDLVLICPVWSLIEIGNKNDFIRSSRGKEALRQGNIPGYHLLNKVDIKDYERDYMVVAFRDTYSLPFSLITDIANKQGKRLRLLPPYREHLSQAHARFSMRVGLPIDIPMFK